MTLLSRRALSAFLLSASLFAQTPRRARPEMPPEDAKAIAEYTLTADKLNKFESVMKAAKNDPKLQSSGQGIINQGKTLDGSVKVIETQYPEFVGILKANGTTPREFVVGSMAIMANTMWAGMRKQYPQAMAKAPNYVTPANMDFCEKNMARIQGMMQGPKEKEE